MIRKVNLVQLFYRSVNFHEKCRILSSTMSTSYACQSRRLTDFREQKLPNDKKTEYGDTFGNIESFEHSFERIRDDPEDILEYQREKAALGKTVGEYIKEVKFHLDNYDYKSALKILEFDMVNDKKRLTPFIYKLLINYNAKVGNLKEAYRLFVRFKSRHGFVTGAIYTSMFNACANCSNSFLAIEKANAVEEHMRNNKNHSVNISNYNVMIKAYGRHGDLSSCLKILDEVLEKRDKVHCCTYNFLLQACISDKNSGFRHALIIWRKMLQNRIKPDIYSFNLMLKCVSQCSLGDTLLIPSIIDNIKEESGKFFRRKVEIKTIGGEKKRRVIKIPASGNDLITKIENDTPEKSKEDFITLQNIKSSQLALEGKSEISNSQLEVPEIEMNEVKNVELNKNENVLCESTLNHSPLILSAENLEECKNEPGFSPSLNQSKLPNLIALEPTTGSLVEFGVMTQPQHRFILLGGVKGFLQTMAEFGIKPCIKTLTLMLNVIPSTLEAEKEFMSIISAYNVKLDTIFFNVLIKRRYFRDEDYSVKDCLEQMNSLNLQPDLFTFGVLAIGCRTREQGVELLQTLRNYGYRSNTEILETLLEKAQFPRDMEYVHVILQAAKEDGVDLSQRFVATLAYLVKREQYFRKKHAETELEEPELSVLPP